MPLAQSIALPPPKATIRSMGPWVRAWVDASGYVFGCGVFSYGGKGGCR